MEGLGRLTQTVNDLEFRADQKCIESLDNLLQDIMLLLTGSGYKASAEIVDLKGCSWVLHERYHMDTEEQLKWTFHHCKHRILKNCNGLLQSTTLKVA